MAESETLYVLGVDGEGNRFRIPYRVPRSPLEVALEAAGDDKDAQIAAYKVEIERLHIELARLDPWDDR